VESQSSYSNSSSYINDPGKTDRSHTSRKDNDDILYTLPIYQKSQDLGDGDKNTRAPDKATKRVK